MANKQKKAIEINPVAQLLFNNQGNGRVTRTLELVSCSRLGVVKTIARWDQGIKSAKPLLKRLHGDNKLHVLFPVCKDMFNRVILAPIGPTDIERHLDNSPPIISERELLSLKLLTLNIDGAFIELNNHRADGFGFCLVTYEVKGMVPSTKSMAQPAPDVYMVEADLRSVIPLYADF